MTKKKGAPEQPKQIVKVKLYADEPNAVLVCKTPSTRSSGTISNWTDSANVNMRTKGNYMHIDVELDPPLPTLLYTNASLVNFVKKHVDKKLDERVVLFSDEEWAQYHKLNLNDETIMVTLLTGGLLLLCGLPTSDSLISPFKWSTKRMERKVACRHDLKFVLVKENEYEEEAFGFSNSQRQSSSTSTVEVTKKRNPDGSFTTTTVMHGSAQPYREY